MTEVYPITCPKCNTTVFSRARHDFRTCPCGSVSIDGGLDYTKINFGPQGHPPKPFKLEVNQTRQELYNDWNTGEDRYGIIQPGIVPPSKIESTLPPKESREDMVSLASRILCPGTQDITPPEAVEANEARRQRYSSWDKIIPRCITDNGEHILVFDGAKREGTCDTHSIISFKCTAGSCKYRISRKATYEEIKAMNLLRLDRIVEE